MFHVFRNQTPDEIIKAFKFDNRKSTTDLFINKNDKSVQAIFFTNTYGSMLELVAPQQLEGN